MSRVVDLTKPLSDEDVVYLKDRSRQSDIDENKRVLADESDEEQEDEEEPFKPTYTVAAPPIEPGSAADNPPKFVGQRPYGVDRAVWGGSTGLTEQEGYAATAGEPHEEQVDLVDEQEVTGDTSDHEDEVPEDPEVESYAPEDLTVDELQDALRERELPVGGNKAELVKRLKKALKEEQ